MSLIQSQAGCRYHYLHHYCSVVPSTWRGIARGCKGKGREGSKSSRVRVGGRSRKEKKGETRKVKRIRVWLICEQWFQLDLVTNGPGLGFTLGGPLVLVESFGLLKVDARKLQSVNV